ncbi:hypothetical protein CW751_12075 [Brumimicrobium salinarum]|uniref:Toxin-antitoxin system YwqK family antitoxin n=1 Tax=Brumimicrobium salinarum TaxID=2058658 RepID=A0A2I0R066_9FLAO|nr:toxin-antitoxin system YwqK family antitoxin [Brumimicrobium salinarum]PKR79959.1 hypothetical protein CW751_12075 [Brumimicrobium salinarum]
MIELFKKTYSMYNFKPFYIILILSFSFTSFNINAQRNQIDSQGRKQGEWVKFYENSSVVRYKGQFKDDEPIGKFVYYYPSNSVRTIMIHDKGSNRTEAFFYHENEELIAHGIYRDKKKDSVWTHFLPTGHYSYTETYRNDKLNGKRITFYGPEVTDTKTKIVLREANYKNGRLNGPYMSYFPDGVKKEKGQYKNGVRDGVIEKYHPNGKIMIKERWKNRTKHGWWKTYDESGKELGRKYYYKGESLEGKKLEEHLQDLKSRGVNPNQ